jgi:hypothetical protein
MKVINNTNDKIYNITFSTVIEFSSRIRIFTPDSAQHHIGNSDVGTVRV